MIDDENDPLPIRPFRDKRGRLLSSSKKQVRARMKRKARYKRGDKGAKEKRHLIKPIEEWDAEELARGRPRNKAGNFQGRAPSWITREVHEESMTRFRQFVRDGMNLHTNIALETIGEILASDETDENGKPIVPASTKLDASKFLVEHVLGKPKQRVETDISVRLQGMMASSIITPGEFKLPALPNAKALTSPRMGEIVDAEVVDDDED
jgi:hypothetical protein